MPARRRPPRRSQPPRYDPDAWSSLVNACRQPRAAYRWALLVPGAKSTEGLPGAGEGGRWFLLPVGALLLRRSPGRLVGLHDLAAAPLPLGPFLLRLAAPVGEVTAARRAAMRAAGRPVVAVPNEGRPMRYGPRLVLSVSADFVRARCQAARSLGLRATGGRVRADFSPDFLAHALNQVTAELESVAEFAWVDVGTLRRWDKAAREVMVSALSRSGVKPAAARVWTAEHVRPWQRSRPSRSVASSVHGSASSGG